MSGFSLVEILILAFFAFASIATWVIFRRAISRAAKSGAEAAIAQQAAASKAAATPTPTPLSAAPQPRFSNGARLHALIAGLLFAVLMISAPMSWLLFGQAGMPLVRLATIGVLLASLYAVLALAAMIITSKPSAANGLQRSGPIPDYDPSRHVDLVARISQRFCPRCRAPLAADAPEGLCPACLMAGGLASAPALDPASGMAVTTPPSGSQPRTNGDWTDLASHFPQLEILELLGRGGMGAVFKARQRNLDRFVALKVIPPDAAKDLAFAERFAREARALARLNHPNIVTVYDFGQAGDVYFLLMEYVDGINLRHAQQASRLSPPEALAIVPQICDALQYAHDQGVVHRDIKPENILLDRSGRVKIADFGLAKMLGKGPADFTLTGTQQVIGTPRYMAPEQIEKPTTVDHRADIYSLGVVIYEMLTGELPLGHFQPPSHKVQIDVRIDQVVLRALEKEPDRRYQRASQVKTELASAAPPMWHTPAPAVKEPPADVNREAIRRRVAGPAMGLLAAGIVAVAAAAIALAASALFFFVYTGSNYRPGVEASLPFTITNLVVSLPTSILMILGALSMRRARSYSLAVAGCIAGIIPNGIAWPITLPLAIWALITLRDKRAAAAFEAPEEEPARSALPGADVAQAGSVPAPYGTSSPLAYSAESLLPALATALGTGATWLRGLSRSKSDQWLGGVCGGLGQCTPIPAWCWRMLFLVLIFGYGVGVLAYVILWICLPEAKGEFPPPPPTGPVSTWLRRMSRSRQDAMLGGVCGGLGENTPLPSWSWRVLFVVLTLTYGVGVIPYVLLWMCLPETPREPLPEEKKPPVRPRPPPSEPGKSRGSQAVLIAAGLLAVVFAFLGVGYFMMVSFDSVQPQANLTVASGSNQDFGKMLKALRAESLDPGKLSFIKLVSRNNHFTANEARQLLNEFSFDPDREEAAVVLYPRVTDPQNFFLALEEFDFAPGSTSVVKRLKLDGPTKSISEHPGQAISRQEFDRLLTAIKKKSFDEHKLAFIKVVSQNGAFTCEQAHQILKGFSFDGGTSGREEVAVVLYPRLSDPQNVYRVMEAFQFDANRNSVRRRLKLD